jgi:hypothetical protein
MGCDLYYGEDGKLKMAICSRNAKKEYCKICGKRATKLCDFPLSGKKEGQTCDAKLCDKCAVQVDVVPLPERVRTETPENFRLKDREYNPIYTTFKGDTVDVCPAHSRFIRSKDK